MQIKLEALKRKMICPILYRHNWDYSYNDLHCDFFRFCIEEMMRWQARKGRGISYDILSSLVSRLGIIKNVDPLVVSDIQLGLKKFTNSGLYSRIYDSIYSMEISVKIKNNHIITYNIPTAGKIDEKMVFITWDNSKKTLIDMKQSLENRIMAVWAFYSLNKYAVFYNLYWDNENKQVKQIRYKPNQFYIRDSKMFLRNIGDFLEVDKVYAAPLEICKQCSRRSECQTIKTKHHNWQKSW